MFGFDEYSRPNRSSPTLPDHLLPIVKDMKVAKPPLPSTKARFYIRIGKFRAAGKPVILHHFWWFVHNCIAHPLIGVCPHPTTL